MGALRTINHPGVEFREYDLSQYTPLVGGTTSLIMGFATKGEDCIPLEITSRNTFLSYFGVPTNEAEKYFYYAANEIFSQAGRCIAAKIPYNNAIKDKYFSNIFSVATSSDIDTAFSVSSGIATSGFIAQNLSGYDNVHTISLETILSAIETSAVDNYRTGTSLPSTGTFEIIDKTRSVLKANILSKDTTSNEIIGYFPIVTTALNALPIQNMFTLSPFITGNASEFMSVSSIRTSGVTTILDNNYAEALATSSIFDNSLSKRAAEQFPSISYTDDGLLDNDYMDKILVSVVVMKNDPNQNNKISFDIVESFIGSLDKQSKNVEGKSDYIGSIINNNSQYIEFYSNIPTANLVSNRELYKVDSLKSGIYGFTSAQTTKTIATTTITTSIDTIFDRLANIDETEIDLVVDAGISNIAQCLTDTVSGSGIYDPDGYTTSAWVGTATSRDNTLTWRSIIAKYLTFCSTTRKDCMVIVDGLRPLVLAGGQKIVRQGTTATIDIDILGNLKNITGINSNYGAMYIDWFKYLDTFTGVNFWLPPSITANGVYIYTDRTANYWDAPAGLNRGVIYNATDIAFNPTGKQADSIYGKSFNYAMNYPYDGIVLEGQKTLQVKPSAFDRVNVRRLFLKLERFTYKTARYYIYEPNNVFTRTRLLDQLRPIFEDVKTRGGIYDYKIICDESNNVPLTIDNNELRLAVLIKPTKTAEFIICDFYALSTGMSFSEVSIQ